MAGLRYSVGRPYKETEMTAHRRKRKTQHKRSTTDVDPYTERYRKASDAAKAARRAAREAADGNRGEAVLDERPLKHLVRHEGDLKGLAASKVVYDEVDLEPAFTYGPDIRDGDTIEVVQLDGARIRGIALVHADRAFPGYRIEVVDAEEALRSEGAPDAAPVVERGAEGPAGQPSAEPDAAAQGRDSAETPEATHQVFFEAEVNGLPTHVGTEDCFCSETQHHWKELGEI